MGKKNTIGVVERHFCSACLEHGRHAECDRCGTLRDPDYCSFSGLCTVYGQCRRGRSILHPDRIHFRERACGRHRKMTPTIQESMLMRIASDQITVETGRRRIRRTLHLARWTGLLLIAAASLSAQNGGEKGLISEQMLWPHLRGHVKILGNRLLTKGKERAVLGGAIVRSAGSHNVTVAVAIDGRIRIDEQNAPSIGHDGNASWHAQGNVTSDESDLLETLVNDTAEHFFLSHARSVPGRFYGSRFRTDDGTNPNYKGPYYDI